MPKKRTFKQQEPTLANGQLTDKRKKTRSARERVLEAAREKGVITNTEARKIGKWTQCWYHLNALVADGLLEHVGYNEWRATKRKPGRRQEI